MSSVIEKAFRLNSDHFKKAEIIHPKILETIVPLSLTKISPRNFHHWKENGLIELSQENDSEDRKWVRLNLIEYVWVSAIEVMREFGLSYEVIIKVKNELFANYFQYLIDQREKNEKMFEQYLGLTEDELKEFIALHRNLAEEGLRMYYENEISELESTMLYNIVTSVLIQEKPCSMLIYRKEGEFFVEFMQYSMNDPVTKVGYLIKEYPHLEIPINNLISEFLNEPKSEKYAEIFGMINAKEMKVLEAIRKRDFIEINIKYNKKDELIIETIKDGEITDEKATYIRKLLGLNKYEEISLTYRNDKKLYIKSRKSTI
ncbi:MAG: hypothetical protein WCK82_12715 [Bacteroidota bacterium]|jgi:hypothetical protein